MISLLVFQINVTECSSTSHIEQQLVKYRRMTSVLFTIITASRYSTARLLKLPIQTLALCCSLYRRTQCSKQHDVGPTEY